MAKPKSRSQSQPKSQPKAVKVTGQPAKLKATQIKGPASEARKRGGSAHLGSGMGNG